MNRIPKIILASRAMERNCRIAEEYKLQNCTDQREAKGNERSL